MKHIRNDNVKKWFVGIIVFFLFLVLLPLIHSVILRILRVKSSVRIQSEPPELAKNASSSQEKYPELTKNLRQDLASSGIARNAQFAFFYHAFRNDYRSVSYWASRRINICFEC